MKKRVLALLSALAMLVVMFTGCSANRENSLDEKKFASLSDFAGETISLPTGSALDRIVSKAIGNVEFSYTKDNSSAIESVRSGKAAAVVLDKPVAYKAAAANSELMPFPIAVEVDDYAYLFPKGSDYVDKFNSALKELRESGKLAELEDYWINNPVENPVVEPQKSTGKNGTVKVTVEDDVEPMAYINGSGEVIGYDIAVCNLICDKLDIKAEYVPTSADSVVENIKSGKTDFAVGPFSITEERKQSVDFCDTTYSGAVTLLIRKDRYAQSDKRFSTLSDFEGEKIVVQTGTSFDKTVSEKIKNVEFVYMNDNSTGIEEVKSGKAAAVVMDKPVAYKAAAANKELVPFPTPVALEDYSYAFRKGSELVEKFNSALKQLRETGKYDELEDYWINNPPENPVIEPQKSTGSNGTLKIAVEPSIDPMTYLNGEGEVIGFDIALCNQICDILDMKAEYVIYSMDSMIQAVDSGKVDLALGAISITEERKQSVDFCDTTYSGAVTLLVRRDKVAPELLNEDKQSLEEKLNKSKIGVMQGTVAVDYLKENYSGAEILEYDSISDAVQALKSKKVDYVMTVYSTAKNYEKSNDELYVLDDISVPEDIAIAVKKGNTELRDKLDALVGKYKSDGTMDKILANWFGENGKEPAYDTSSIPENDSSAPVLTVGVAANREPMCFVLGEGYGGVDIELIKRIAYELGMRTEFRDMNFSSLIPALENGKVDVVVSNIVYTEERANIVDFTQPYFDNPQVLLTRKTDEEILSEKSGWEQFWSNFKDSFTRTFITENRWKLVLNGLGVTIIISICAFIVGSIWGGVICALLRSKRKIANIPAKVYVRLLQGTPIVVLLMILYYIVFKDFDINAIVVAIIGFALNLGAYTSQIFKTAIESVDKGQIEAASAMGFNKFQVFIKIIFPQAARNALPVYKGEFISLVKSTSIVGYIAIQDLTKVSDIIRSRTYEAFFPLIATAIIYFLVTYIFIVLLNVLEKKIDPKRRKRVVKGVDEK